MIQPELLITQTITGKAQACLVKYDTLDESYAETAEQALLAAQERTSAVYYEVVFSRILISSTASVNINGLDISIDAPALVSHFKGPLTSAQFIKMLQYDTSISNAQFYDYLKNCKAKKRSEKKQTL